MRRFNLVKRRPAPSIRSTVFTCRSVVANWHTFSYNSSISCFVRFMWEIQYTDSFDTECTHTHPRNEARTHSMQLLPQHTSQRVHCEIADIHAGKTNLKITYSDWNEHSCQIVSSSLSWSCMWDFAVSKCLDEQKKVFRIDSSWYRCSELFKLIDFARIGCWAIIEIISDWKRHFWRVWYNSNGFLLKVISREKKLCVELGKSICIGPKNGKYGSFIN